MELRTLLGIFLGGVLYPIWLLAGAGDYLSHRATHVETTSGPREAMFHIAQFVSIAVIFVAAVLLEITLAVLIAMVLALLVHTALSLADVAYTLGRRHISSIEQHVHGFMDVIPFIAVCILAMMHWETLTVGPAVRLKDQPLSQMQITLLLGSFAVLAGTPIVEEWLRTRRARIHANAAPRARDETSWAMTASKGRAHR